MNLKKFGIEFGNWESIRNHAWLFIQPLVMGIIAIGGSKILRLWTDIYFHPEDREFVITGPLAMFAIFHSILAGHMFMDVLRRHREVCLCVLKGDHETFGHYREIRLPGYAKAFLAAISLIIVLFVSLIHFHYEWTSNFSVFCVTFVLSSYWVAITELEDPVDGVWFGNRAPADWLKEKEA
jgi:hypothetical protein